MSGQSNRNVMSFFLSNLGWPVLSGLTVCGIFYGLVLQGPLHSPTMLRYFATHPVSYAASAMFCIGMAALLIKMVTVTLQFGTLSKLTLDPPPAGGQPVEQCSSLLDWLGELPPKVRDSYLGRRLHDALESVERKDSADDLNEELKYLADLDAARQQDSFALVRIIIWATPMLGFLGTVIGITTALGDLGRNSGLLASEPQRAMEGLLAGLYVAFDTTALALSLSIILMFVQFLVDRIETQLLTLVDAAVNEDLVGRFEHDGGYSSDPQVASIERMSHAVVKSTEVLVNNQAKLWQQTIDGAHQRWHDLTGKSGEQLQTALTSALNDSLTRHDERLADAVVRFEETADRRWQQWQTALSDNARLMRDLQQGMTGQAESLAEVVRATADVTTLQDTLNSNLNSLAGSKNFEDTVMSLAAAIHLLNTRLGAPVDSASATSSKGRAA